MMYSKGLKLKNLIFSFFVSLKKVQTFRRLYLRLKYDLFA